MIKFFLFLLCFLTVILLFSCATKLVVMNPDNDGFIYPAQLFQLTKDEGVNISFYPRYLESLKIKGEFADSGYTWNEIFQDFVDRFDNCFDVKKIDDSVFYKESFLLIEPNAKFVYYAFDEVGCVP